MNVRGAGDFTTCHKQPEQHPHTIDAQDVCTSCARFAHPNACPNTPMHTIAIPTDAFTHAPHTSIYIEQTLNTPCTYIRTPKTHRCTRLNTVMHTNARICTHCVSSAHRVCTGVFVEKFGPATEFVSINQAKPIQRRYNRCLYGLRARAFEV